MTSHIFRHTYVSLAVEQGIDKDTIAKQVGHANTKMIDNIYLHITEKMEQDIADKLHSFQIYFAPFMLPSAPFMASNFRYKKRRGL